MGLNAYLTAVGAYGYDTETAGTAIKKYIDGKPGNRVAIIAFGVTCGARASHVYFMQALKGTTLSAAATSGTTTIYCSAAPFLSSDTITAGDTICIQMDDGTYHWSLVSTYTATGYKVKIATATDDSAAAGNGVWNFGTNSDERHIRYKMTASGQATKDTEMGIFFGSAKGAPMLVYHPNTTTSSSGSIDFLTYGYMKV